MKLGEKTTNGLSMKNSFTALLIMLIISNISYAQTNISHITQVADNSWPTIGQTGKGNSAYAYIYRDWSLTSIEQFGDDNYAEQHLVGDVTFATVPITYEIIQTGKDNYAEQHLTGDVDISLGGPTTYSIEQIGDDNEAVQDDTPSSYRFEDIDSSDWCNSGDWIDDGVTEILSTTSLGPPTVSITQSGNENKAYQYGKKYYSVIYQYGYYNEATQNQIENGNEAEINQSSGDSNYVYQLQEGSNNSAVCTQNGYNLTHRLWQSSDKSITVTQTNLDSGYTPGDVNIKQH